MRMSMSNARFFVVAPHSFCASGPRNCDLVALAAVDAIKEYDSHHGRHIMAYHIADRLRELGDYNRPWTDHEPWRVDLREKLTAARPDYVIEMHSFPGAHPMYVDLWKSSDLVLFKSPANAHYVDNLAASIRRHLARGGHGSMKVMVVVPWHPVAITDDAARIGLQHTLFEFNEDMPREHIAPLAAAIHAAVREHVDDARHQVSGGSAHDGKKYVALVFALVILLMLAATSWFIYSALTISPSGMSRHDDLNSVFRWSAT
jgi:hypothetical protein